MREGGVVASKNDFDLTPVIISSQARDLAMNARSLVSEVEACFPKISVENYRVITSGWDNLVLEVNGQYIFRFPRFRGGWTRLRRELAILPSLSPHLGVATPRYEFVWGGNREHPWKFAGYRKLEGLACAESRLRRESLMRLGRDMGSFLSDLHSFNPPQSIVGFISRYNPKAWTESRALFHRRVRRLVYPRLRPHVRKWAEDFWQWSLEVFSRAEFEPTLIHADLRGGNVIISPSTGELKGIIDWDNAAVADPALDFMGMFELNHDLGEIALRNYRRGARGYRERVEVYLRTIPFGEVAQGVRVNDKRLVDVGLRHIARAYSAATSPPSR
jgi:aminoglycoside 2''-phosphotransferase